MSTSRYAETKEVGVSLASGTWTRWLTGSKQFIGRLSKHPSAMGGGIIMAIYLLVAVFAPVLAPHSPIAGDLADRLKPPAWIEGGQWNHIFGADEQGMDLLSRIIYGARISILIGLLATTISIVIGTVLGLISGYFRGWFDTVISRFADLLLAFPFLIFAIGMMAFLGPGFNNLILALTFKGWVEFFRIIRGEVMVEKTKEYVEAAKALGRSSLAIMVKEILPNIIHSVVVLGTLRFGYMMIMEASLSFLGLGIQPPTPAWGSMIATGREYMLNGWWLSTIPGIFLVILVLSINLLGEGLRDLMDHRLKAK
ncbi:ABC transporter permease [Paenibacillus radicis (ex Xue et al. 2023)]|uniref:ABC transporter permease n=1 Tax=Paenibacillus radicis (ex Xue et al. 2023) TaxID=2972489 RepID=A0ABT1YHP4_9BACL|nr:ABC transporter permease [Paenibacillus radicis (ex Xue et al. 2023)]MCR8632716.1 ABC transporter permease [Paenibacillus radicis (ex Xue et al. 2023)]